jgi:hypothetical protein
MLPYSEMRGHCLTTGLQLLIIRSDVEKNPEQAAFWRKEVMRTVGVLTVPEDWRSVIESQSIKEANEP